MVAVYGATGYTGKQVARTLVARGCSVILAGRTRPGLQALADELDGTVAVHVGALDDPSALRDLTAQASVIINCAGPFAHSCRPVAEAAIAGQAHYVDISAEQLGSRWCYEDGHTLAQAAGVALLPSFGFYSVIADLLAVRASADLGSINDIQAAYWVDSWHPTGTSLTARFQAMGQPWYEHDHGVTRARQRFSKTSYFEFPDPIGRRRVCSYPMPEVFVIPWHLKVERVTGRVTTSTLGPKALGRFLPSVANAAGALMRTPARPLVECAISALWKGTAHGVATSDPTRFIAAVNASGEKGSTQSWLSGRGIYDITAPIAAEAAMLANSDNFVPTGTVAPAQLLNFDTLLGILGMFDLKYGEIPSSLKTEA